MITSLLEILGSIALLLAFLTVLGAAAATFLTNERIPVAGRWALSPLLGLSIAICLHTTLNWHMPASDFSVPAVVVPLLIAVAVLWHRRRTLWEPGAWRGLLGALTVAGIVAGAFALPVAYQHSVGPGGFQIWDGPNYAGMQTALIHNGVNDYPYGPDWSRSSRGAEQVGSANALHQQIGFDSVAATFDSAVGLQPIATQVPFMIALVVIAALGAYALFLALIGGIWGAIGAGLLVGGPVLLQLVMDGSEGALAGIAHLFGLLLLGLLALRERRRATAVLFTLVAASAAAAYPVFFPGWVVAAAVILAGVEIPRVRALTAAERPRYVGSLVRNVVLVACGAAVLAPFAFGRNLDYWHLLIEGKGNVVGLPVFNLKLPIIPGYVLGTREFYNMSPGTDGNVGQWLLSDVVPITLLALLGFGMAWWRKSLWPVLVVAVVLILVTLGVAGSDPPCSYCVQRSLLPLAPVVGFALAASVMAIGALRVRHARAAALLALGILVALTWHTNWQLMRRDAHASFWMPRDEIDVVNKAAEQQPSPLLIEGFAANYDAPAELPTALLAAGEGGLDADGPRLSLETETNDFAGLAYIGGTRSPVGPEFDPNYKTVVTRLGNVQTARKVLQRSGGMAIERRVQPFDVTAENGVFVNRARMGDQRVFIVAPMSFAITGPRGREVALQVRLRDVARNQLDKLPRGTRVQRQGTTLTVCIPATGQTDVIRRVVVPVAPNLTTLKAVGPWANHPTALAGPVLEAMRVVPRCG